MLHIKVLTICPSTIKLLKPVPDKEATFSNLTFFLILIPD